MLPNPIPEKGLEIPVTGTYLGPRFLSMLALTSNRFNPQLRIYENKIEYRLFRRGQKKFDEIEKIDSFNRLGSKNLIFYFVGKRFVINVSFYPDEDQKELLKFFQRKNICLTEKAQKLIAPN